MISNSKTNSMIYNELRDKIDKNQVVVEKSHIRKYHLNEDKSKLLKERWKEQIKDVPDENKTKVSKQFFNPYRQKSCYYGIVQSLFLLGANEWHSFPLVRKKVEEVMKTFVPDKGVHSNCWDKFVFKSARVGATNAKDSTGRLFHNIKNLQRLRGYHPYGWKLRQVLSCIDIKRDELGFWYIKLNTSFKKEEEVNPIYDTTLYEEKKK